MVTRRRIVPLWIGVAAMALSFSPPALAGDDSYMGVAFGDPNPVVMLSPEQKDAMVRAAQASADAALFDSQASLGCRVTKAQDMPPSCTLLAILSAWSVMKAQARTHMPAVLLPPAERPPGLLARQAKGGDRHAMLHLGIAFEEGRGLPRDLKKARKLYRMAAADSGGTMWIYVPGVGNAPGRVMPFDRGPFVPGLAEAKERLSAMAE